MEKILIVSSLLIMAIMIFVFLFGHYRRIKKIDSFFFFSLAYNIYYFIAPIITLIFIDSGVDNHNRFIFSVVNASFEQHIFAIYTSALGYVLFYIIYIFFSRIRVKSKKNILTLGRDRRNPYNYNIILFVAFLVFFIALFAEVYLIYSLGGLSNALSMINVLRAGTIDKSSYLPSNLLFLFTIYPWIHASTFLFFLAYRIKRKKTNLIMFTISMILSVFAYLLSGGRLQILLFLLCFSYDYFKRNFKHPYLAMVAIAIFALSLLETLDNIFYYLTYGSVPVWSSSGLESILEEFLFPFANLLNVSSINEQYGLNYGIDFISWPTYLIPSPILSIFDITRPEHGYLIISEFYNGADSIRGTVPMDVLTLGYRQFSFFGIIIIMISYALICVIIDKIADKVSEDNRFTFLYIRICMIMFIMLPYADIENFVRNHFNTIILIAVVAVSFKDPGRNTTIQRKV